MRFWGQMVRWLAGRDAAVAAEASVVATTDKAYYEPEQPVGVSAVVRNQQGEGARDAKVIATIRNPAGQTRELSLLAESTMAGSYTASFEPEAAGTYEIAVEARVEGQSLHAESLTVEVGRPNLEFERLDLDDKMLGQIASDSGGRYFHITTADRLPEQLDRTLRMQHTYRHFRLYWPPLFWLLFVATLTAEWVLRRRFQLR